MGANKLTVVEPARGHLTPEAVAYWKEATNRELTVTELRLMPFIQYTVMNGGKLEGKRINADERKVLTSLQVNAWIVFRRMPGQPGWYRLGVSQAFWERMNHVLLLTYVWTIK